MKKATFVLLCCMFLLLLNCYSQIQYNIKNKDTITFNSRHGKVFNLNVISDNGYYKRIRLHLPEGFALLKGNKTDNINKDSNSYSIFVPNDYTKPDFNLEIEQIHYSAASRTFATIWRAVFKYPIVLMLTTDCFCLDCICVIYSTANSDYEPFFLTKESVKMWPTHRFYKNEIATYDITLKNNKTDVSIPEIQQDIQDNQNYEDNQDTLATNNYTDSTYTDSLAAYVEPIIPEMVKIEGGTYFMGDSLSDSNQRPMHKVTVSTFSMSKNLITVAQFSNFCEATGRDMPEPPSWGWNDSDPMVNVNYYDAEDYCTWLSEELKTEYRLPTEAEWEYAARGGNKSQGYIYSGSNDLKEVAWYNDNSGGQANITEYKKPNEVGIYDMSGNVFEWCKDWYKDTYSNITLINPIGPAEGVGHVMRGGCWDSDPTECRVKFRTMNPEGSSGDGLGFRIVSPE